MGRGMSRGKVGGLLTALRTALGFYVISSIYSDYSHMIIYFLKIVWIQIS